MKHKDIARKVVSNLIKPAAIEKRIEANSSKDLFGGPLDPEDPAKSDASNKDLFGNVVDSAERDRSDSVLPSKVQNSDTDAGDISTEDKDLNQGYDAAGKDSDDMYTGSGDGPLI